MNIPESVLSGVDQLSAELNVTLQVEKWWENEDDIGHYCRAMATVLDSPLLRIQLVASLAIGTGRDEIDLFVVVNGDRVSPVTNPEAYLFRRDEPEFRWDHIDMGYEVQTTLDSLLLRNQSTGS